jgi:hypothetical protein
MSRLGLGFQGLGLGFQGLGLEFQGLVLGFQGLVLGFHFFVVFLLRPPLPLSLVTHTHFLVASLVRVCRCRAFPVARSRLQYQRAHCLSPTMASDLDRQIEQLRRCETIKEAEVKALCDKARDILIEESNVQRVDAPVTVRHTSLHWYSRS